MSENSINFNFVIEKTLKKHLEKIAKKLTKKWDRKVSVGELIRKAIIEKYGKPETEEKE
jgi:hypothetical protein